MDAFSDRPVYVSARGVAIAGRNGMNTDRMRVLAAGETVRTGGLCVTAYRGRHCSFDMPTVSRVLFSPHTWLHIGKAMRLLGEAKRFSILPEDVFVFSVTDGEKTAVILGSAGMAKGEDYPQNADLLVFPYQGKAAMHRKIPPFLDAFRPKKVMIDHFDDAFPPVSSRVPTKKFPAAVKSACRRRRRSFPSITCGTTCKFTVSGRRFFPLFPNRRRGRSLPDRRKISAQVRDFRPPRAFRPQRRGGAAWRRASRRGI